MLSPTPNTTTRLAPLDGLRGVAILMIFLFHSTAGRHAPWWFVRWCAAAAQTFWAGVPLFFLLSGFLITGILWDSRGQPRQKRTFFLRRAFRILPLYGVCLLLALAAAAHAGSLPDALAHLWGLLLFLQDIPGAPEQCLHHFGHVPLFHLWSLAVEEQFYLLWPCLLLRQPDKRSAQRLCLWVMAGSTVLQITGVLVPSLGSFLPLVLTRSAELALGGWIALAWRQGALPRLSRYAPTLAVASGIVFAWSEYAGGRIGGFLAIPAASLAFAAILVLALERRAMAAALSVRPLRVLGHLSYGMYLLHVPLAPMIDALLQGAGVQPGVAFHLLRLPLLAASTFGAAFLAHHLLERPAIRLGRHLCRTTSLAAGNAKGRSLLRERPLVQSPEHPYNPSFLTSSL